MRQHVIKTGAAVMLQNVIDALANKIDLSETRRRDLRSALTAFTKIKGASPSDIILDLADIRRTLERVVPAQLSISRKRFSNLRSDLAAGIDASGVYPMLSTAGIKPNAAWSAVMGEVADLRIANGLSRFTRWASLRGIAPDEVDAAVIERFVSELESSTLIRNVGEQRRNVIACWNRWCASSSNDALKPVAMPTMAGMATRLSWEELPTAFRADVDQYLHWCEVPDPLDEAARDNRLAPGTLRLRREHIHSAASAACAAGVDPTRLASLAALTDPGVVQALLRQCWIEDDKKLTAYTHGIAGTLITIAREWVKPPLEVIERLKTLRRKLGQLPSGLTAKNQTLLRKFDNPDLVQEMVMLPDRLWRRATRDLKTTRKAFIELQSALAIDLLLHVALRMANLATLSFERHLHWPQARGKAALLVIGADETKNAKSYEFEISKALSDRLWIYRHEIAPQVTGKRPDRVFVRLDGQPRGQQAITVAIEKVLRNELGIAMSPHQFRHLCAKLILDSNPGAYEQVRQMLGHKNSKTTLGFYTGSNSRRAGRAHGQLLISLREQDQPSSRRRRRRKSEEEK